MKRKLFLPALLLSAGITGAGLAHAAPADTRPFLMAQASDGAFRMQQIEEEVRQLNGRIEELNFQLLQMQEQMRKMQEDNEFRFQQLEGRRGALTKGNSQPDNPARQEQSGLGKQQPSEQTTGAQRSDGDPIARVLENNPPQQPGVKTIDGVEIYQGPQQPSAQGVDGGLQPQSLGNLKFDAQGNVVGSDVEKPIDLTGKAGGGLPGVGGITGPGTSPNDSVASLALPDNPDELYDLGYSYIQAGEYARAEDAFEEFSARYPDSPKIAEARFWVGESLLSRGMYQDAAKVFLDAHKRYPGSRMGSQTMLKLGISLAGMDARELACATFAEIPDRYPDASNAIRAKVDAEQKAAKCKGG